MSVYVRPDIVFSSDRLPANSLLVVVFTSASQVGFGTIVGSAVFNILFVIGSCAFASSGLLTLTWWPLSRDVFFYATALILLTVFFYDDKIYLYEGGAMFAVYVAYVIFMCYNEDMQKRVKAALRKLRGQSSQPGLDEMKKGEGTHADTVATSLAGKPKYNENKIVPIDDDNVGPQKQHEQGVVDGVPEKKGTIFVARPREDSLQVISVHTSPPASEANDKSGGGASKAADASRGGARPRGFSDTSQDGGPASPRSGDGGDVGIEGEKYFAEDEVKGRKKPRPSFDDGTDARRSSTGMLRHMKITKGSNAHEHDREIDSMIPTEARRGRRMYVQTNFCVCDALFDDVVRGRCSTPRINRGIRIYDGDEDDVVDSVLQSRVLTEMVLFILLFEPFICGPSSSFPCPLIH